MGINFLPWRFKIEAKPRPPSVESVMELSLSCQEELAQVRLDLIQIRKDIEAVRRKVYRDVENTAASGLVEIPPGDPRLPVNQVKPLRTGDPI